MTTPLLTTLQAQLKEVHTQLLGLSDDETCPPELRDSANKLRLNIVSMRLAVTEFEKTVDECTASMRESISTMRQMFGMLGIEEAHRGT